MDPIADIAAEHVVNEPVLGDPADPTECRRGHDRVEVAAVAGHLGTRSRDAGLDPILQFPRGRTHAP